MNGASPEDEVMEMEPTLAAYESPGTPCPTPPRAWGEQYRPISKIQGMDFTDTPLRWWVSSTAQPPWDPNEVTQMWVQLWQLAALPEASSDVDLSE